MNLLTARLNIRPIQIIDSQAVFEYRGIKEINQHLSLVPETVTDVEGFIARSNTQINLPNTWFQLVLIENESNTIIGDIGLHFLATDPLNAQVEIGYTLHPKYHGKGYAKEALQSIIGYLFSTLNKHRIIASVDPKNSASINLLQKLGFRKEAHLVKSLYFKGAWVDDVIFALLKEDWTQNQTQ